MCDSVSNPSSAEHRSRLSGRRPLSERPSTRVSHCRVPTEGSAGLGRWPARHVTTMARSRDFHFRKSALDSMVIASCVIGRFRDDQAVTCCLVVVGRGRRGVRRPLTASWCCGFREVWYPFAIPITIIWLTHQCEHDLSRAGLGSLPYMRTG